MHAKSGGKRISVQCKHCGISFLSLVSEIARGNGMFCSRSCASKVKAKKIVHAFGEKNPNWKGGVSKDYYRYKLKQIKRYPERVEARALVKRAICSGALKKKPCSCGNPDTEAHHNDYSKPLEVVWLCKACHRDLHEEIRRRKAA